MDDKKRQFDDKLEQRLEDLVLRFLIPTPEEERTPNRIFFHIQEAHWHFKDFDCDESSEVNNLTKDFKEFSREIFKRVDFLRKNIDHFNAYYDQYRQYKSRIEVYGSILIREDNKYVLLVESAESHGNLSFPKGKLDENETPERCAIRETMEETNYDISKLLNPLKYVDLTQGTKTNRMYIVENIPKETQFTTQTRCEINSISWYSIDDILKKTETKKGLNFVRPFLTQAVKLLGIGPDTGKKRPNRGGVGAVERKNNRDWCNNDTFGGKTDGGDDKDGWHPEEMFRVNREKFGVESSYSLDHYCAERDMNDVEANKFADKILGGKLNAPGAISKSRANKISKSRSKTPIGRTKGRNGKQRRSSTILEKNFEKRPQEDVKTKLKGKKRDDPVETSSTVKNKSTGPRDVSHPWASFKFNMKPVDAILSSQ
eukprot:CAMPEP_0114992130 /NCGR_PEP_ID=MMETSP0216-20121206/11766_1 /TAXON_ID=223996 /ORGANISM="Protocruzia adherens, Strain Boccale" /LENGTH=428 /DNA_ID=CAMNT_0002355553 /DNA_START=57 /DNA_END=1343 /DNA_ORIENTATION=-